MLNVLSEKELFILRGKAMVDGLGTKEVLDIFTVLDSMETLLDMADQEDFFGTEGWRHHFGWDE